MLSSFQSISFLTPTRIKHLFSPRPSLISPLEKQHERYPVHCIEVNGGGSRAFQNEDLRVDHVEVGTGNRVVQIQAQTQNSTLKRYMQKNGTHVKIAVVKVNEDPGAGGKDDTDGFGFFADVVKQTN
ncbi:hypothetical protein SERLA73DRAFT_69650 [Serpula lacrymans var. lacrymans S7.3]|uniref:Uncharacterized protein n=1 Tax=Serpula lacrymans var. lacrymans (strain S7.3) TaxID=936435 RepID=F8PJZ9_SERL3|nr:hypothetical protein SERLA73DRAFT_69650 [Serpula lacrymans var. lacrymans S7.3]